MSRSEAYGYAVARIRAMEPLLFDSSMYQRMLDADGLDGALKVLAETTYGKSMSNEGAGAYDEALETELLSTFEELRTFVPDKALIDIFRVPYDYHNVKVIMKGSFNARAGGKRRPDLLTKLGTLPTEELMSSVESEDCALLPYGLSSVVPACMSVWEQTKDIVEIERLLDQSLFAALLSLAESVGEPGVIAWVKARIDAENLRNLLRLKRFGFDAAGAAPFLHAGGTLAQAGLLSLIQEPFDSWSRTLSYSSIGLALSQTQDEGDFDRLIVDVEKTLDDYCQSFLEKARFSASAPENVLAYLWGKEQEMKNIRTIMVSKSTGSSPEETRRLMRHGY